MRHLLFCGILLCASLAVRAQLPTVDIAVVPTGDGHVEVRVRPDGPFDGVFSSIVFTLRWSDANGATLGSVSQQSPVSQYCGVARSGSPQASGGHRYQVFAGFGNIPMVDLDTNWTAGQEVVLCRVAVNGNALFDVADDAWTAGSNGGFYVSLNGEDRTGLVYHPIITGTSGPPDKDARVRLSPNPTDGVLWVAMDDAGPGGAHLELLDATGRRVWEVGHPSWKGVLRETIDLRGFADGVFLLKVTMGGSTTTHPVILGGR